MSGDKFTADKLAWIEQVATDPELSPLAKVVACILAVRYLNRETGDAWPANDTLAADAGRGKTQVHESIKHLETRGHLEVTTTPGGKGHTNRYRRSWLFTFCTKALLEPSQAEKHRLMAASLVFSTLAVTSEDPPEMHDFNMKPITISPTRPMIVSPVVDFGLSSVDVAIGSPSKILLPPNKLAASDESHLNRQS